MRSCSLLLIVLASCAHSTSSSDAPPPASAAATAPTTPTSVEERAEAAGRGKVIGTIVTHDAKVSILAGNGSELRVIVRKRDGQLVADGITLDELRAQDPILHSLIKTGVASRGTYLDATLDRPERATEPGMPRIR